MVRWLYSVSSVSNSLMEHKSLHGRIMLANIPSAENYLDTIMTAMKNNSRLLKVKFFQANYMRDLPLHESQQEIERNEEYSIFELFIRPTYDLYQEVLRMGTEVEVLAPLYMREEIIAMFEDTYKQFCK